MKDRGRELDERAERIRRARNLLRRGLSLSAIATRLGMSAKTLRKYADESTPLSALGRRAGSPSRPASVAKKRFTSSKRGPVRRQFPVHPEIARLRDAMMAEWRPGGDVVRAQQLSRFIDQLLPTCHPVETRPVEQTTTLDILHARQRATESRRILEAAE